ncbi:hypothetical protein ACN263_09415 [Micromonospora sp. WMMD729]|uniref:hypothetical protein n=1 Tax=Micromonospora sp. WMMD729 TaxID=3404127 RepID=UPI003BF55B26
MVRVTRGGVLLSVATMLAFPLLTAVPALAAPATLATPPAAAAVPAGPSDPLSTASDWPLDPLSAVAAPAGSLDVRAVAAPAPLDVLPAAAPAPQPGGVPGGAPQPGPVDIFVEVSPSTVQPGYLVGIRASCRDNSVGATVVSDAFGAVGVQPQHGVLTAAPMVRERTRPGNYRVKLECRDGETASTMLQVVKKVPSPHPSRGPATGFGGTAGGTAGKLLLPGGAAFTVAGLVLAVVALRRPRRVASR